MKHLSAILFQEQLLRDEPNLNVAFIDVRTPEEYSEQHISGAQNIPLSELPSYLSDLVSKQSIYLYCRSGGRSQQAAEFLERQGIAAEIFNLEGGVLAWERAGLPLQ